jgi:hypothetical protein
MKKLVFTMLMSIPAILIATPVMAHRDHKNSPCKPVWKACMEAQKDKTDIRKCVESFKTTGAYENVKVSPTDVQACQTENSTKK